MSPGYSPNNFVLFGLGGDSDASGANIFQIQRFSGDLMRFADHFYLLGRTSEPQLYPARVYEVRKRYDTDRSGRVRASEFRRGHRRPADCADQCDQQFSARKLGTRIFLGYHSGNAFQTGHLDAPVMDVANAH